MALAIYRKYRPKNFDEVLGQDEITKILKNAGRLDKIAHAYLFYGARGTGKTTVARILAKIINCETRRNNPEFKNLGEPCNACDICHEIDSGKALDLIEIDAASNRGIDEIRNLQEGVRAAPIKFPYKVFIIDEVHMLTKEAFNALLKTLEEPPSHIIFILATTEMEKIPATIASRTQRFHFRRLNIDTILIKLREIAKKEDIKISDEALALIADAAEGSFRDAESILDQVSSMKTEKEEQINEQTIEEVLGKSGLKKIIEFVDLVLEKEPDKILAYIHSLYNQGYNLIDFNKELIHYLARLLALKQSSLLETILKKELTDLQLNCLKKQAPSVDTAQMTNLLKSLIRAYSEMRYSPLTIAPLLVALIENFNR